MRTIHTFCAIDQAIPLMINSSVLVPTAMIGQDFERDELCGDKLCAKTLMRRGSLK